MKKNSQHPLLHISQIDRISHIKRTLPAFCLFSLIPLLNSTASQAGVVAQMTIVSAPQTIAVGKCSAAVTVQSQDSTSTPANVKSNTTVFFTGSSSSLSFYKDSSCATKVSTVIMASGTSSKNFFFKGSIAGSPTLIVATYNYVDGSQKETLTSSTNPTPTPAPTATPKPTATPLPTATPAPTATPSATPSPTPAGGGISGRSIPSPIYGVTLDNVDSSVLPAEVSALRQFIHFPTTRVVFDGGVNASYYAPQIQQLHPYTYIMGQLADSSTMSGYTATTFQQRTTSYTQTLGNQVDIWEVGNEVNGGWLGTNTMAKISASYDVVSSQNGQTAITFFWEGEPSDPNNCMDGPGNDVFGWITQNFQLNLNPSQRSPETEKIRLGLNYVLMSWYPSQCPNVAAPNWNSVFTQLSTIFPNAKVGFGELGTPTPENGSAYEINLINQYYPMAKTTSLPANYIGGYFWWNFAEEINSLLSVINGAIQ